MHIKHLDLEKGDLIVEGLLIEMVYAGDRGRRQRGKGLMERLFK